MRHAAPQLTRVLTWNSEGNDPMLRINHALGYRQLFTEIHLPAVRASVLSQSVYPPEPQKGYFD